MGSLFGGGGGGGGSPPTPPKLKMIDTSMTGPLYTETAQAGQDWANLMRGAYGLGQSTGPSSWEAAKLGPGALANMAQAGQGWTAPGADPQGVLRTAFGVPATGQQGAVGGRWNLGNDPFQVAKNLGQNPLQQLQRNVNFTTQLTNQWQAPSAALPLTGADLLNVKFGTEANAAAARQQAYQAQLAAQMGASGAQSAANAAQISAFGNLATSGIRAAFNYGGGGYGGGSYGAGGYGSLGGAEQGAANALGQTIDYSGGASASPSTSFFGSGGS